MEEKDYDQIMSEAEKLYKRQEMLDDPYSFHKAFEFAQRRVSNEQQIKRAKKMKKTLFIVAFSLLITLTVLVSLSNRLALGSHVKKRQEVSGDFKKGFNAGVRYGLIAFMQNPQEDNISTITKEALKWYWLIEIDEGKCLIDSSKTEEIERIKKR